MRRNIVRSTLAIGFLSLVVAVKAGVPVVDLGEPADISEMPIEQRVTALSAQMAHYNDMDLLGKIEDLQQRVQELNGKVEMEQHVLEELRHQQRQFYQDLDRRISRTGSTGSKQLGAVAVNAIEPKLAQKTTVGSKSNSNDAAKEQQAYQAAFTLLTHRQYNHALDSLAAFVGHYPTGRYAPNAYYWMGEIYFLQGHPGKAKGAFTTVIDHYSKSRKVPDAMLKLAMLFTSIGEHAQAKKALQKVITVFPTAAAARLAKLQLQEM